MFRDLGGVMEIGLESSRADDRCDDKEEETKREGEKRRSCWVAAIGKAKGRRINPVMACNREWLGESC